jgi:hypothetical protein
MKLKKWMRLIHRYGFGYLKSVSLFSSIIFIIIAITGILLVHKHDLRFMQTARISTTFLPSAYEERLRDLRENDGLSMEENPTVPLSWVVYDLHSGEFLGSIGPWLYDIFAIIFIVLSITGIYLFWIIKK